MANFTRWITTPHGQYPGHYPHLVKARLLEHHLSIELAVRLQGAIEVTLACGRADIATATDIFEVEPVTTWRRGLQQTFAYAAETGLQPNLALFGERPGAVDIYLVLRDKLHSRVQLWLHSGTTWWKITNRQDAKRQMRLSVEYRPDRLAERDQDHMSQAMRRLWLSEPSADLIRR